MSAEMCYSALHWKSNAWGTINQICLSDKLYINYSYEAVHHFPAHNSKIIYCCLGFIFKVDPLWVTLSPCKHLYTCKGRRGAFHLQLSALSWDAAAPHWVSLMMMLGGLRGLCHGATLVLWDCYSRLWIRLHEKRLSLPIHRYLPLYLALLTVSKLPVKTLRCLSFALKYARINDENVY